MTDYENKDPFEEFGDAELAYRVASLGLVYPNEERYSRFFLAAREYKKAVRKLTKHLKEEIKSIDELIDSALKSRMAGQTRHEEGEEHD